METQPAAADFRWFVVQARPGMEKAVARSLAERIGRLELHAFFGEILVPSETVVELRDGQKRQSERKFFPGYLLVQIAVVADERNAPTLPTEAWHAVRQTPKVNGFVGGTPDRPLPITDEEAEKILNRLGTGTSKPAPKVIFDQGQTVRVTEGPFNDFHGSIESVDYDRGVAKVAVLVFGRATPVEFALDVLKRAD